MATLSRKTISIAVDLMSKWSQTRIEQFFYENDIESDLIPVNTSKRKMILDVFRALEDDGDQGTIEVLIAEALKNMQNRDKVDLEQALLHDGFVVNGAALVDAEPQAAEQRSAVMVLMDKHKSDLDFHTLSHHLDECENLFHLDKWDSSIGHCRNFVEQLLRDIAKKIAADRHDTLDWSKPRSVREYLLNAGFFDDAEKKKLVDGVYGYFSEEGSHPGISTQSAARVSKSILLALAFYMLEKYDAWSTIGFKPT